MKAGRPEGSQDRLVLHDGKLVRPRTLPTRERFLCYVDKQAGECWIWTGTKSRTGYGRFSLHGKAHSAHRFAYTEFRGAIPDGLELDHLCRNRACVRPDHLEPVIHRVNVLRSPLNPIAVAAQRTTCSEGHLLPVVEGKRRCFICSPKRPSTNERLTASYEVDPSGCWRWTGEVANGYPRFFAQGRRYQATRYVYEHVGANVIPPGAALLLSCESNLCVNPDHMSPVVDPRWHPRAS